MTLYMKCTTDTKNCRTCRNFGSHHGICEICKDNKCWTEKEPTTKNDLGVDCISREQALVAIRNLYPGMPRVDFNGSLRKWVDKYKPYIECDDAIKQLPSVTPQEPKIVSIAEIKYDKDKLKELVNKAVFTVIPQEPKVGHWIDINYHHYYNDGDIETTELRCSCCNEEVEWDIELLHKPYYCENCGAKMVEPQESEDKR